MKKLNYLLLVIAVAMAFAGCRKPVDVSFENTTQEIDPQGGSIEMALRSNGEWTINSSAEWITVSPMSGKGDATLIFTADANTTGEDRATQIKAITKDNTATVIVTQGSVVQPPQPQYYLNVSPKVFRCGSSGGEFIVEVSSNVDWNVSAPQWITCSVTEGSNDATVTLTVSPIEGEINEMREAEVVFESPLASDRVHVVQTIDPIMGIEIMPKNLDFVCTGETKIIAVFTDDAWTASMDVDWVTLSQAEGQGDAEIRVTLGENPIYEQRQTTVLFTTAGGIQAMLGIRQEASPDPHFLEVSPLEFQFGKEGGEQEISVSCDIEWEFDLECDWLTLSQQSGVGNATVVLSAEPNVLTEPRTKFFNIKSGTLSYQLIASQAPGDEPIMVSFDPDTLYVAYIGGLQTLSLTSNTTWLLQASSWITLLTSSGEGDASFDIAVDSNQDPDERIGFVNAVHNGQEMASVVVVQEGKPNILETDMTELDVRPEGGSYEIQVTANQSWTVDVDVDWVSCDPQSGFGNKTLTVTVGPMMGARPRTGHIKLSGEAGNLVIITVNQHQ
jgi:hypothetical protein